MEKKSLDEIVIDLLFLGLFKEKEPSKVCGIILALNKQLKIYVSFNTKDNKYQGKPEYKEMFDYYTGKIDCPLDLVKRLEDEYYGKKCR